MGWAISTPAEGEKPRQNKWISKRVVYPHYFDRLIEDMVEKSDLVLK